MENSVKEKKPMNKGFMLGLMGGIVVLAVVAVLVVLKVTGGSGNTEVLHGQAVDYEADGYITLGEYKGVSVSVEVTDEDIKSEIDSALEEAEIYEQLDGTATTGNMVCIDYSGYLDGQLLEDWTGKEEFIELGAEDFFAEFDTGIVGMNTGDKKNIDVVIPDDYDDELTGKTVQFEITLNYICGNPIEQELTDEFVSTYTEGECTSVDAFNDYMKESLYQDNLDAVSDDVWTAVIENTTLEDYHKGELKEATDETMQSYKDFAEFSGYSSVDEFLESVGMTEEDCEDVGKDVALERMTAKTIAAKESLVMDDETYKQLLVDYMEYEDEADSSKPLEDIETDYRNTYAENPRDAMLMQFVKDYLVGFAEVKGKK